MGGHGGCPDAISLFKGLGTAWRIEVFDSWRAHLMHAPQREHLCLVTRPSAHTDRMSSQCCLDAVRQSLHGTTYARPGESACFAFGSIAVLSGFAGGLACHLQHSMRRWVTLK